MSRKMYSTGKINILKRRETEYWIYSYADLITNLLALFIMLLVLQTSPNAGAAKKEMAKGMSEYVEKITGKKHSETGSEELDKLLAKLAEYLKENKITEKVTLQPDWMAVDVTFGSGVLFAIGDATLTPQSEAMLSGIGSILKTMPKGFVVEVEGHADNLPISSGKYPSNWELSSARAGSVVRVLASQGIPPRTLKAIGFADSRPIDDTGASPLNRRVIVKINKEQGGAK